MLRKEEKALELLTLLYGDQAGAGAESAGGRLMRWAEAFDAWLDQREAQYNRKLRKCSRAVWRDFLSFVGKVP